MVDLNRMTREFLLGESHRPSVYTFIQSIEETLHVITPRSQKDSRRVELAKSNLREIRREFKRVDERVNVLEERVKLLDENKES